MNEKSKEYPNYIRKIHSVMQEIDFRLILPAISRMPLELGNVLSKFRGVFQAATDYDWRSMALGRPYVRQDTWRAMKIMFPKLGVLGRARLTFNRFLNYSKEEWESCLFSQDRMEEIARKSKVQGIENLRELQKKGRGVVLVSSHLGSFCTGMVLLGMKGLKTNVLNTVIIEDKRIHPAVRSFFDKKYRAMESRMNGLMPYHESDMNYLYDALKRGEIVVLLIDTQGSKSTVWIPFLNRRFRMPLGAWKMAKSTGSLLGAFVCLRQKTDSYRVILKSPVEVDENSGPKETMLPIYRFLERWMCLFPDQWLAAEHLMNYGDPDE